VSLSLELIFPFTEQVVSPINSPIVGTGHKQTHSHLVNSSLRTWERSVGFFVFKGHDSMVNLLQSDCPEGWVAPRSDLHPVVSGSAAARFQPLSSCLFWDMGGMDHCTITTFSSWQNASILAGPITPSLIAWVGSFESHSHPFKHLSMPI
jgi:hypothetical protein